MEGAEQRLAKLEAELSLLRPSLHERLERLEKSAAKPRPRWYLLPFAWMGPALPQLIVAAVMLFIAFWVKDSVDLAIKQQQLHLAYVKEMKEQLEAMAKGDADPASVERAAVLVAGFGQSAVMPLLNELRYGGNRALGAEAGLRTLAFMHPEAVCTVVLRVLKSPSRSLGWEGHMVAARTLAAGGCTGALGVLVEHEQLLDALRQGKPADLATLVTDPPGVQQQKEWQRSLRESIAQLKRQGA